MTNAAAGGPRRPARLRLLVAIAVAALPVAPAALAADGDLQRALLERGCVEAEVTAVLKQRDLVVYRANCLGSSHRIIDIVCGNGRCRHSLPGDEQDR